MNKLNMPLLALTAIAVTQPVMAVSYGTPMTQEEYKDYWVHLVHHTEDRGNEYCGAQFITPTWLVTARHCTPYWDTADWGKDDPSENGAPMELSIYQGLEGRFDGDNLEFKGTGAVYTLSADELQSLAHDFWIPAVERLTEYSEQGYSDDPVNRVRSDIALINLNQPINYNSTLTLGKYNTTNSNAEVEIENPMDFLKFYEGFKLQKGDIVEFSGWGLNESNQWVQTMHTIEIPLSANLSDTYCMLNTYGEETNSFECTHENAEKWEEYEGDKTVYYRLSASDTIVFQEDENLTQVRSGDSGTGLIINDTLVGVVHAAGSMSQKTSTFQVVDYHLDWILETVNQVTAPAHALFGTGSVSEYSFSVQNLTPMPEAVDPYLVSDVLELTHDCPQVLEPMQSCSITISGEGFDTETLANEIVINQDTVTMLSVIEPEEPTDPVDPPETPEDGDSDGGSIGFFGLLGMLALAIRRRK
ncbi:GlyGly-CTERM sorting domain-containing protein [Vibrio agarivorans]|uniref:Trypsin-like serine protease n=1 Tax=Vibrio agarivorans TaxID=153622 RepID=A0ABT7Y7B0_9VIBR|nr:GlyGly-CTERM sorting domain-containing protein [Vibrio agarivorans]MDN2483885.1 trypsin-like serine protease [Vibrio agarivorans]